MGDEREFVNGRDPRDAERHRIRRRRALVAVALVLVLALGAAGSYVWWALTAPVSAPAVTSETPEVVAPAAVQLALPTEVASAISISGADAYLGAEANGIWAASGPGEARSIASISKLITALVILDERPLANADDPGPTITFDKADHDLYDKYYTLGATTVGMPTGSSMSQNQALATMLIPSASNYAEALSTWAFGSQDAFVGATRRWLAAQGLSGTTIVEPTGINPRNASTPGDLVTIGKLAAANPVIARIAATESITVPDTGRVYNTNHLLGNLGITGLKTGSLGENNSTLLYTASLDVGAAEPLGVTGVVLGGYSSETVGSSVLTLLASIRDGFHDVPVATADQNVGSLATPWGSTAQLVIGADASIFTWSDTPVTATMELTTPVTYTDGEVVGSITFTAGPNTATAPVRLDGSIEPPTDWWRLTHPGELGQPW